MPAKGSSVLPAHVLAQYVLMCIASGLSAQAWGKSNGLSVQQSKRLSKAVNARLALIKHDPSNIAQQETVSLRNLTKRLQQAMTGSLERAASIMERLNDDYAPKVITDKASGETRTVQPIPPAPILSAWKFAWQLGSNALALSRKHNEQPPGDPNPDVPKPAAQRAMEHVPPGLARRIATPIEAESTTVQPLESPVTDPGQSQ